MPDLSIIILSYNTKSITKDCLSSIFKSFVKSKKVFEMIIVDNNSTDGSIEMIKSFFRKNHNPKILTKLILNKENRGFSAANNQGIKSATGKNILFINSDTIIKKVNWDKLLFYFNKDSNIAVLTIKVLLPSGKIDPASHRGFPSIWNSFCYFSGLEKILGRMIFIGKFFSGYHLLNLNFNSIHEIDSPSGTFYLIKKNIIDNLKGFDERFFMYGEDIDLSFRVKQLKYKIIYYPYYSVLHLKSISGLKKADIKIRYKTKEYFYTAMKIFYDKHYARKNLWIVNQLIYFVIEYKLKNK